MTVILGQGCYRLSFTRGKWQEFHYDDTLPPILWINDQNKSTLHITGNPRSIRKLNGTWSLAISKMKNLINSIFAFHLVFQTIPWYHINKFYKSEFAYISYYEYDNVLKGCWTENSVHFHSWAYITTQDWALVASCPPNKCQLGR